MTADNRIWIGQNGQKYGPYSEADVRQWMAEGKLATDALAWREGMENWVPLSSLFAAAAGGPPPPLSAGGVPPFLAGSPLASGGRSYDSPESDADARAAFPAPPSLHWGLVLLFATITLGIFGLVWPFIQASWVRKIDRQSKAMLLLALAFGAYVVGEVIYFTGLRSLATGGAGLVGFGGLLLLSFWILYLVAYFSMAGSLRRSLSVYGVPVEVGGVTLFFFTKYYLQGQLSWVARWKDTGQTIPKASKGIFWMLLFVPVFVIAILAAIAIPAYQDYLVRAQVSDGMLLADGARTAFTAYYDNQHAVPSDNTAAGLAPSTSIAGRYVSSVDVSGGKITVAFDTLNANALIRYKVLVLSPTLSAGQITWTCNTESTVPNRDLPISCRH